MPLSRQRLWQILKKAEGLCTLCGKEPLRLFADYCDGCGEKRRERDRKARGCRDQRETGRGRPRYERESK